MATQNSATLPENFGQSGFGASPTGVTGSGGVATDFIAELTVGSNVSVTDGILIPNEGLGTATNLNAPTCWHSGGAVPPATTTGTEVTATTTVTYVVEVFIPVNCLLTGVSLLNASSVAGNAQISLADNTGAPIAAAQTASTAVVGTAAYQQFPFVTQYAAVGPQKYFVLLQCNNTGNKFRTHVVGNFTAGTLTSGTFGTFTTCASLIGAFLTGTGPICDTY